MACICSVFGGLVLPDAVLGPGSPALVVARDAWGRNPGTPVLDGISPAAPRGNLALPPRSWSAGHNASRAALSGFPCSSEGRRGSCEKMSGLRGTTVKGGGALSQMLRGQGRVTSASRTPWRRSLASSRMARSVIFSCGRTIAWKMPPHGATYIYIYIYIYNLPPP